jgi:hypothetical protein
MIQQKLTLFFHRAYRHFNQTFPNLGRHQTPFLIGITLCLGAVLLTQSKESKNSLQIFQHESHLDFKNASILGNPGRTLLQEEESNLSKTQRSVLESQNLLKKEVALLRLELEQLKTPGIVQPAPSGSPSPLVSRNIYGPEPLPSPDLILPPLQATIGEEFNHTRVTSDHLRTRAAAPKYFSTGIGLTEMGKVQKERKVGTAMISFPVKSTGKAFLKKPAIVLPSGSYVKAMLLTGIEAPEGKTYPVLMQLDYAYVIPNDKRLDLAGCFMIAKAQGDLSTERVQMQATKLSCVSRRGGMFERDVNGFVADHVDNSFAVIGQVNTKQDRVAATAFLSGIVSGIGKAIQLAQTTQQATPLGGAQSLITGDQAKYIGAGGVSDSASMVTQWYLKQAQNLLPTINVGSGQEVWIVMQDQTDLPKDYFTQNNLGEISNASIYSYFTRLID